MTSRNFAVSNISENIPLPLMDCVLRTNKFHYLTMFTNLGIETNALVDMYAETDDVSNHVADQETVNLQI